jgi:diguanylate cyclase (GGDEF)-like protein
MTARFTRPAGGLGSRVALRTFLLFAVCATAPVALFALLGHAFVRDEMRASAVALLENTSKRHGVLIYERLGEIARLAETLARLQLAGPADGATDPFTESRVRILSVRETHDTRRDERRVEIVSTLNGPSVRLHLTRSGGGKTVEIVAEPVPEYLWDADASAIVDATLCVYAPDGTQLNCTPGTGSASGATLQGDWHLFLKREYGAGDWLVRAQQPLDSAVPALRPFQTTLLVAATLAIGLALLVSSIQIRRSHRPLAVLTAAVKRLSQGRFDSPVRISSRDEYARLARAFNRMSDNLQRQFHMLAAFARIDRLMLSRPALDPVVESLLPKALKLLRCDRAVVVLRGAGADLGRVYVASDDHSSVEVTRARLSETAIARLTGNASRWLMRDDPERAELACLADERIFCWYGVAIRVGPHLRGALLLGFPAVHAAAKSIRRNTGSFARRLAVALGNEDRENALLRPAYYDSLTGLPNRQLFKDRLQQEVVRARRARSSVALLFIDLDRFKTVNDSLGHSAGDELLQIAAQRLSATLREGDTLARLGGDEFTVIAPGTSAATAGMLAARMLDCLKQPATIAGMQCVVEASIGIALSSQETADAELLLRNADTAMYRAKAAGRGAAVYFEEAMNSQAMRRLQIEQRLRSALDGGDLQLHYQRKVRAKDGVTVGVEALARWTDAQLGAVSPGEFIPVAEDSGLIAQLDHWSIREACRAARRWHDAGLQMGHVAVNVSLRHLRNERFVSFVQDCLTEFGVPTGALELEITESTLAEHPEEVGRVLAQVRQLGVRIAIDDFGTGYSSMAVLQKLPIDLLKIDRAFITHCADEADAGALLKALLQVAHGLGKEVVAEGVETPAQAAFLRAHGCEFLQGYLFARPVPADVLERDHASGRAQRAVPESRVG